MDFPWWGGRARRIEQKLDLLVAFIFQQEERMAKSLDDIIDDVTAQTTVVQSVVTLVAGLKTQLDAAIASGNMAKVQQVADGLEANTSALANAVKTGT